MRITRSQLRRLIRENISSMSGSAQWKTWETFREVYEGLNDKFRQDMDQCLYEDMIGEDWMQSVDDLDDMYEGENLEDRFYELASERNWYWEVESFRKYNQLHTPDRIMTALWFIVNKEPLISNFAYSIRDEDEIYEIAEQCKVVVDTYGLAPSFKDMIDSEAREASGDHQIDKEVGVVRMTDLAEGDVRTIRRMILESSACERLNDVIRGAIDEMIENDLKLTRYMYNKKLIIVIKERGSGLKIGILKAYEADPEWDGNCLGGYIVEWTKVKETYRGTGLGALLYDVALEMAGDIGLIADRASVTYNAFRNWKYFMKSTDYIKKPLDNGKGELTPDIAEDNCSSGSYYEHGGSMFIGDVEYFRRHPLNQLIVKKDKSQSTLQCLGENGLISETEK